MSEVLSDRQRIELAIPAYLLFALSSVPGVFAPSDPERVERAEADISSLREQLRAASLEPFGDLMPRKRDALLRRLERVSKSEFTQWKDQPALSIMLKLWFFLENLIGQGMLILWEESTMDHATLKLSMMCAHGFRDSERVATAHEQAAHLLGCLQTDGLYLPLADRELRAAQDVG